MKDWLPVFRRARASLVILGTVLALCLLLFFGSAQLRTHLTNDLSQKQAQTSAEQERLNEKQKDFDNIRSNIEQFRQLQQRGMIGTARREDWVEQLVATRKELGLPDTLAYTLKQPAPVSTNTTPEPPAASEAPPTASDAPLAHNLEFELRNIHEEELLALLKTYQGKANGRFRVQSCRLTEPSASGLQAQCTLRFFTLPQKAAAPTTPQ